LIVKTRDLLQNTRYRQQNTGILPSLFGGGHAFCLKLTGEEIPGSGFTGVCAAAGEKFINSIIIHSESIDGAVACSLYSA
jgi:hypothetical protein